MQDAKKNRGISGDLMQDIKSLVGIFRKKSQGCVFEREEEDEGNIGDANPEPKNIRVLFLPLVAEDLPSQSPSKITQQWQRPT